MQDPLLKDIRRARVRRLKELKRDFERAIANSNERLFQLCDVVISPTGEQQFVASKKKMHDVLIAPSLRQQNARTAAARSDQRRGG